MPYELVEEEVAAPAVAPTLTVAPQDGYELIPPPEETPTRVAGRFAARTVARGAESLLGLPGEIARGVTALTKPIEELPDIPIQEGLLGNITRLFPSMKSVRKLAEYLPTSETVQEYITKPISKHVLGEEEYIEPKGSVEKLGDSIVSDLAPMLVGKIPFTKALTAAGLGNIAKWAAGQAGVTEPKQEGIKLGTMLFTSLLGGPVSLRGYAKTLPKKRASQFLQQLNQASSIQNFIKNTVVLKNLNPVTGAMLGYFSGYLKPTLGVYTGIKGLAYMEKALKLLSRNPSMRKYYKNAIVAATKQRVPMLLKNINNLDTVISKKEKAVGKYELITD